MKRRAPGGGGRQEEQQRLWNSPRSLPNLRYKRNLRCRLGTPT